MATRLKQIISVVALAGGATQVFPHLLNWNTRSVIPDHVEVGDDDVNGSLEVLGATTLDVTIRNNGLLPVTAFILLESWHTLERDFGAKQVVALVPQPFIPAHGGARGIGVDDEGVPVGPGPFTELNFVGAGVTATDAGGGRADITIPGQTGPVSNAAMFFGMTTGTGNAGPDDYAATVAVGAPVPFPRNGPTTVGAPATRSGVSTTDFVVANTGIYEVGWTIDIVEASQLQLALMTAGPIYTAIDNTTATSGAGTQQNVNKVLVSLTAGDVIAVINPAGNATALTVQPANGSLTHAQAPSIMIQQIG